MKKIIVLSFYLFVFLSGKTQASNEEKDPFQIVKTNTNQYDFSNVKDQKEFVDFLVEIKSKHETHQDVPELGFLIEDAWQKITSKKPVASQKVQSTYETLKQQKALSLLDVHEFYAKIAFAYDDLIAIGGDAIGDLKQFSQFEFFNERWFVPIMLMDARFDVEVMNYAFLQGIHLVGYGFDKNLFFHGNQWHMQRGANHDYNHGRGEMLLEVYRAIYDYAVENKDKKLMYSLFWMWHEVEFSLHRRDARLEEGFSFEEPLYVRERINSFNLSSPSEKIKYVAEKSQRDATGLQFLPYKPIVAEMDDEEGNEYYRKYKKSLWWEKEQKVDYVAFCKDRIESRVDEISFLGDLGIKMKNIYKIEEKEVTISDYTFLQRKVIPDDYNAFGKELNALFKEHIFDYLYGLADKIAESSTQLN